MYEDGFECCDVSPEYDGGFGSWHVSREYDVGFYDADTVRLFVSYVDKTMQRYHKRKFRITELKLVVHKVDEKLKPFVDQWIKIAVQNQIQELDFDIKLGSSLELPHYKLPEILFCANSLKILKCYHMELPYYQTMKLISLEYLTLHFEIVDENMLQRIISFCPLVNIILHQLGPKKISLFDEGAGYPGSGTMQSNLTKLVYARFDCNLLWPPNMNVSTLKNLKKLEIDGSGITDHVVSQLAHGLVALECLELSGCRMLKCVKISSVSLKKFEIRHISSLINVTIDAPNLLEFRYECDMEASLSLIRAQEHCNVYFSYFEEVTAAAWFLKLNKFFLDSSIFTSLLLDFSCYYQILDIADLLCNDIVIGQPYKLRELKLLNINQWKFSNSYFEIILDGLFTSCHPDVLSITTIFDGWTPMAILDIMKKKVKCWKHPLKSIEVGADYSSLLSESSELEIRFKLFWLSD